MNEEHFTKDLKRHEGLRLKPYLDSVGILTIGYGRNLKDVGITEAEADYLLENDIAKAIEAAIAVCPSFGNLDSVRQEVLVNLAFNIGKRKLSGFKKMLAAIDAGDFQEAACEMLNSRWATQVGSRAKELAERMRTGVIKNANT